jgi:hypothetical protein
MGRAEGLLIILDTLLFRAFAMRFSFLPCLIPVFPQYGTCLY